jgi:predicted O-methyltransferase YrrM
MQQLKELPNHCFNAGEPYYNYIDMSKAKDNQTIIDIGTYRGFSAFAFGYNKTNEVHSFDIADYREIEFPNNVKFHERGALQIPKELIKKANIILLDVDPHDGVQEFPIFEYLIECGFKGTLIIDDVMFNEGMEKFYDSIQYNKYLCFWHHTGTGIVNIK